MVVLLLRTFGNVKFSAGQDFSLHSVWADPGSYPVSFPMSCGGGGGGLFPW
jgi:hypothetical protein